MKKLLLIFFFLIIILTVSLKGIVSAEGPPLPQEMNNHLFNYDVVIDIGHGGIDGGTYHGNVLEKNLNLEIGSKLYHLLKSKGYKVGITRVHDYALSDDSPFVWIKSRHQKDLMQRELIAEGVNPRLFISIHVNYSSNKNRHGPVILYKNQAESYLIAQLLQAELNQLTNTNKEIVLGKKYYLLKNVDPPCLIAEVGYISHPHERAKLQEDSYQQLLAEHFGHAIDQFFLLYP